MEDENQRRVKLRSQEMKELLDHHEILQNIKDRMDRVSLDLPTIEVRFENVNVDGEAYVGKRGLPTIINSFLYVIEDVSSCLHIIPRQKKKFSVLDNVTGIIKPGRMTLLLGPPGSGKTTLLLALSGKLGPELKVSGKVTYNGHEMHEFDPQRTCSYVSQTDVHIAEMTVRETLAFSVTCQGFGASHDLLAELLKREKEQNIKPDLDMLINAAISNGHKDSIVTDYILKILGLEDCADTLVGNEMVRGISGGQRKRLTVGEMLVGPVGAFFMDNISTGLDSVTTFQIINSIKQSVLIFNKTVLVSLLQPSPETYNLFDDIILIVEGQIVYQGPRECVLKFFESMGFKCPTRKCVADYLQEVTSRKDQKQYWAKEESIYTYISVNEFVRAFRFFHIGRAILQEIATPFDRSKSHPSALAKTKYSTSGIELLRACFSRECLLMKRNSCLYFFKIFQHLFLATIAATLFGQSRLHHQTIEDGIVYLGALYCGLIATLFTGVFELPMTIDNLPIFYEQRGKFYPAWAYSLPVSIVRTLVSTIEVAIWIAITYYAIGFVPTADRAFKHFFILALGGQMSYGFFRCIAAICRDHNVANTGGNLALIWLFVFSGFALSRQKMKKWLIWGYWTSPLMYTQTALSVNEFLYGDWTYVFNNSTEALGISILKSRGIITSGNWYWIGIGVSIGFIFLFTSLYSLGLTYLNKYRKAVYMCEEGLEERHANKTWELDGNSILENRTSTMGKKSLKSKPMSFSCLVRFKVPFTIACFVSVPAFQTHKKISNTKPIAAPNVVLNSENTWIESTDNGAVGEYKLLPFTPLSITFQNIKYSIDIPRETKAKGYQRNQREILKGVSGAFRPGVLTALMGVSGAGKTTLLDVLAGRKNTGKIEGNIQMSGYPKQQKTFSRVFGYCEQNDIHSPLVTVYESLLFSAWLRLPSEVNQTRREIFVEKVMQLIALTPLRGALVGFPSVNGLSIEQRRRLTIAVELVANPSIIFMDEPTTGLDSRAAAIVVRSVRHIVDTGRAVVCTIHQPSIDIFEAFDELFLLSQGGEEIYVGPLGTKSASMVKYFEEINGIPKIEDGYNPATWVMEVTAASEKELLGVNFADIYKNSDLYRRNKALIRELSAPNPNSKGLNFPQYSQSCLTQFKACLWRQHKSYWRNTTYNSTRLIYGVLAGFILGIVFWGLGSKRNEKQDVLNGVGSMYMAIMFMSTHACFSVIPVIAAERAIFYRERAAGVYSAFPYALAQLAIEVPYTLAQTLVYGIIVYTMIGFEWSPTKFFLYLFFFFFTFLNFTYFGMMVVAITPNQQISASLCGVLFTMWNLFSGFLIPRTRVPVWWKWYEWICPVSWSLYGLATLQYGDNKTLLNTGETVADFMRNYFGYRNDFLGPISLGTLGFGVFFAATFAVSVWILNFQKM